MGRDQLSLRDKCLQSPVALLSHPPQSPKHFPMRNCRQHSPGDITVNLLTLLIALLRVVLCLQGGCRPPLDNTEWPQVQRTSLASPATPQLQDVFCWDWAGALVGALVGSRLVWALYTSLGSAGAQHRARLHNKYSPVLAGQLPGVSAAVATAHSSHRTQHVITALQLYLGHSATCTGCNDSAEVPV